MICIITTLYNNNELVSLEKSTAEGEDLRDFANTELNLKSFKDTWIAFFIIFMLCDVNFHIWEDMDIKLLKECMLLHKCRGTTQ